MSFSITAKGSTKAIVIAEVAAQLAGIVAQQPVHAADEGAVRSIVESYLCLLPDEFPEGDIRDYKVDVSGWLNWAHVPNQPPQDFVGANVACTVGHVAHIAAA